MVQAVHNEDIHSFAQQGIWSPALGAEIGEQKYPASGFCSGGGHASSNGH